MNKRILLMGGTGAMGIYLIPELLKLGYKVDVMTLDNITSDQRELRYIQKNAMDKSVMRDILKNKYDAIVDFMIYTTMQFAERFEMFLENTEHYIFLSTYRVYANEEVPIKESSPRLIDASKDTTYQAMEEYGLFKARCENILFASKYQNWTIVRPAITYSKYRFQLTTLEAPVFVRRAKLGLPVIVPKDAMKHSATMSWGGDVAKMISRLILNEKAMCEAFTVATSEHQTWETIAGYYKELLGLECILVDNDTFLKLADGMTYQLKYDRCYERIIDNSKILSITGLSQSDLMPLKKGLKTELDALPKDFLWGDSDMSKKMDKIIEELQGKSTLSF